MFEHVHIYFKPMHPVGYFCLDKTHVRTCGASDTWRACAVLGACCACGECGGCENIA